MPTEKQNDNLTGTGLPADFDFCPAILNSVAANIAVLNGERTIVAVNSAWQRFADENQGLRSCGVGVNYLDMAKQATGPFSVEAQAAYSGIRSVLDGSLPQFSLEYPCHAPTKQRWFQMVVSLVRDKEAPFAVVMHYDITERKLAEESLRVNELRLGLALEAASMGTWIWDIQANQSIWNSCQYKLLGLPSGDGPVDTNDFWNLVHPDDLSELNRALAEAVQDRKAFKSLFRVVRPDGVIRWLAGRGEIIQDESVGHHQLMCGVNFDVTESVLAEESLRRTELLLRQVLDTNPNIIQVKDRDSQFLIANQAVADFYNLPMNDIIGHRQADIHSRLGCNSEDVTRWLADDREVIDTGKSISKLESGTDVTGKFHWYRTKKLPLQLTERERAVLIVSVDITDLHDACICCKPARSKPACWWIALKTTALSCWTRTARL